MSNASFLAFVERVFMLIRAVHLHRLDVNTALQRLIRYHEDHGLDLDDR